MKKTTLPTLPYMIFKALLTLKRKTPSEPHLINLPPDQIYNDISISIKNIKHYKKMFPKLRGNIPLTYLYLIAQRAQVSMMLHEKFPFSIPGLIHINNQIKLFKKIDIYDNLIVSQHVMLDDKAKTGTEKIVFQTYFRQNDQIVAVNESVYFTRTKKKTKSSAKKVINNNSEQIPNKLQLIKSLSIPENMGRKYAKISGDYNPIHLHKWLSIWFGFKKNIIHGMYMVSKTQEALENKFTKEIQSMTIDFLKPIMIAANVDIYFIDDMEMKFCVTSDNPLNLHLKGTFTFEDKG